MDVDILSDWAGDDGEDDRTEGGDHDGGIGRGVEINISKNQIDGREEDC